MKTRVYWIHRIAVLFALALPSWLGAQNSKVSGHVYDLDGNYLAGATVQVAGQQKGVTTSPHGGYSITGLDTGDITLIASYIGFKSDTQTVRLSQEPQTLNFLLRFEPIEFQSVVIEGVTSDKESPIANQIVTAEEIQQRNLGQDIPMVLDMATSVVSTSDAGNGIGYTGMRIRGSDATRVNVTINGIPYNDAESQSTFWVDLPDIASSVEDIRIQRGVGTSTNGTASFGGTVNLNTARPANEAYGSYAAAFGSFNTQKHTVAFGTGLLKNRFSLEGRLSQITSDGFIDRAASKLQSYYLSANWSFKNSNLNFVTFNGQERTYQAWYGGPESLASSQPTYNPYTYENQIDNYGQNHFQLHWTKRFDHATQLNISAHYTKGAGYWEEYLGSEYNTDLIYDAAPQPLSNYGLSPVIIGDDTISESNLVQQRWLDNDFYGVVWTLKHNGFIDWTWGGGINQYLGSQFGDVVWMQYASDASPTHRFYENSSTKTDANTYLKATKEFGDLKLFADLQYRMVDYQINGPDWVSGGILDLDIEDQLNFFNPKFGATYHFDNYKMVYASASMAGREPVRGDYTAATENPLHEQLVDYEAGFRWRESKWTLNTNLYFMDYTNQLVNTGELNQSGYAIRTNVEDSYRAGIEIEAGVKITAKLRFEGNITLSQNKIASYTQYYDNWLTGGQDAVVYENTDIALSPNTITAAKVEYTFDRIFQRPKDQLTLAYYLKYVGEQYLDNTGLESSILDAYLTNDLRINYVVTKYKSFTLGVNLLVRNVLDQSFVNNGWIYRFSYGANDWDPSDGDLYTEPDDSNGNYRMIGLYPQAGRNFLLGITIDF